MTEPSTVVDVTPKKKPASPKKKTGIERICQLRFVQFITPVRLGGGIQQVPAIDTADGVTQLTLAKWHGLDIVLIESAGVGTCKVPWQNIGNTEEL